MIVDTQVRWPRWRSVLFAIVAVLAGLAVATEGFVWYTHRNGNLHVVEAGQVYRAARLPASDLAGVVERYGIRSVLNLEGARPGKPWYQAEVQTLDRLGVARYDDRISATRMLTPSQVDGIIDILRTAPKPLLVHCRDGSDRTGLVSALYLAKILGRDEDEADQQLSLAYGHFPYLGSATRDMDDTYWMSVDPARHPR
jgi:protein tyrosine phosphatase (PTP) superfamily phosphohydrolase (DUF442 family)